MNFHWAQAVLHKQPGVYVPSMQSNTATSNYSTILKWLTGSFYSSCISALHSDLIEKKVHTSLSSGSLALCDKQRQWRMGEGWWDKEAEENRDTKMHM